MRRSGHVGSRLALFALFALLAPAVAMAALACQALAGINDLVIGDCKGGACSKDGGPDNVGPSNEGGVVAAVDSGVPCNGKGPRGVRVGAGDNTFCIDATEVTVAQYKEFVAANVPIASQPGLCQWNASFESAYPAPNADAGIVAPGDAEPEAYVNWCQALAYCSWAGKYLCGKAEKGKKTGPVTLDSLQNTQTNQWLLACSAGGQQDYPYGAIFDPSKCNLADLDAGQVLAAGSLPGCTGGFAGVSDMVGNVWEWYDGPCGIGALEVDGGDGGPQSDECPLRGGSYGNRGADFNCRTDTGVRRDARGASVGFRCCSD
jgi:formylglycine-generating enzyme required for sulfatase activity